MEDEEVLAWKALEEHDAAQQTPPHAAGGRHAHSGDISTDDDFSALAYDATRAAPHDALLHASSLEQQHVDERHAPPSSSSQQQQRFKRKNFSKQLQLLCLQRYAQYAKAHGKLPDKTECQFLLHQSYLQFLKDGGAADEPRLSHQEFLKLIRNRRREMYVRNAQKHKFQHRPQHSGASNSAHQQPLSAAKRKLQQEHAKIYELIEIIDQAREQSGLVPEHHHHHPPPPPHVRHPMERHHLVHKPSALAAMQEPPPPLADPQDQIDLIFQLQQETLEIQREIAERLKVIRLHRGMRQTESMEPSSASV